MTGSEIAMSRQAVCKFENISPGHRGLKFYLSSGELDVKVKFICRDHIFCVEYVAFFIPFPVLRHQISEFPFPAEDITQHINAHAAHACCTFQNTVN